MPHRRTFEKATKRLLAILPGLFVSFWAIAQSDLVPYKITIFQDAVQIGSKGIVRFHQQEAEVPLPLEDVSPETMDLVTGADFSVTWFRVRDDSVKSSELVGNWNEVLKANISRKVTIVYEIGGEFDEITGDVRLVNEADGLLLLHGTDESEYFIPLKQVKQVIVETLSDYRIDKNTAHKVLQIGINKDVPFVPLEMFTLHQGIRWEPICRIRILGSDKALLQMHALIENNVADFVDVDVELSSASIHDKGQMNAEIFEAGKLSLKKGDRIVMNFRETQLDYSAAHKCNIPWAGPLSDGRPRRFPVENTLQFTVPNLPGFECDMHAVIDENNRQIANIELTEAGAKGNVQLKLGQEKQIRVNVVEEEKKRSKKPEKVGDKLYDKVSIEGKIVCYNVGQKFVQLKLMRELMGELTEHGKAIVVQSEKGDLYKNLNWKLSLDKGQKKEVRYKYDALIPYVKK